MFLFPARQQIVPADQTAHYPLDVVLGDGLQDDTAELVLQLIPASISCLRRSAAGITGWRFDVHEH